MTPPPDPTPPVATPVMMTDTYVEVSAANLKCLCTSVSIEPENKPIEVTTFCGVQDYPGPVKWHFKATFLQSFDSGATDEILGTALADYEADGSLLSFSVRPYSSRPESATNPTFSGQAIPQPYTIFGGDAGTASEVDIDWIMSEPPTRTPPLTVSQALRAEPVSNAA
jgi:hypothetical protein